MAIMKNKTGAKAWRKVEGVMEDRRISRKLKKGAQLMCIPGIYVWPREMALTQ